MTEHSATIEIAEQVDDELVAAFEMLIPQLSSSSPPPSRELLTDLVDGADTVLFLARLDGAIIGSLTLAFYRIPTGIKAWIEDVVVDDAARGHGVGRLLNEAALDEARDTWREEREPHEPSVAGVGQSPVPADRLRVTRDERLPLRPLTVGSVPGTNPIVRIR